MTETTKKESIMASLILSNEGVSRENEGDAQRITDTNADTSLFASVPIVGDSGDVSAAGSLPFALAHGEATEATERKDASEKFGSDFETPDLQVGREPNVVGTTSTNNPIIGAASSATRSHASEDSSAEDGHRRSEVFYNGTWSGRQQQDDGAASLGHGNHQPLSVRIRQVQVDAQATRNQAWTMPAMQSYKSESREQEARQYHPAETETAASGATNRNHGSQPPTVSAGIPPYPYQQNISTNLDQRDMSGRARQAQNLMSHPGAFVYLNHREDVAPQTHHSNHAFGSIVVSDPLLISSSGVSLFGLRQPPHWSYQIQTSFKLSNASQGHWVVRRRFRHVVALEERLRQECPGAILPPRPDKHAIRALEEATAHQSTEFALHRALELQIYLNALAKHPYAMHSNALRLFLSLQDDLGTAWVEVSSNALTRLANVGVGAAIGLSETTSRGLGVFQHDDYLPEDSAELLSLQATESTRMGAVSQAVPKLEGCIALLREHVEATGSAGIEFQKAKLLDDLQPFELLANGMLRSARRTKRSVAELMASAQTFVYHCKLLRYEKLAFADRKQALLQRASERGKADHRAAQLAIQQRQFGGYSAQPGIDELARDASFLDQVAMNAMNECDEIGKRVVAEVGRTANVRRMEWSVAVGTIANLMKDATSERVSIWTSVRDHYMSSFTEL